MLSFYRSDFCSIDLNIKLIFIRFSNLSEYKDSITSDIQYAGIADIGHYNERLESTHAVESAVIPNVDIPVLVPGLYYLGIASLKGSLLSKGVYYCHGVTRSE